jgi:hypothetical protein
MIERGLELSAEQSDAAANQAAARRQTRKRTGNANGPSGSTVGVSETIRAGTEELKEGKPKLEGACRIAMMVTVDSDLLLTN